MAFFCVRTHIDAPPKRVWDYLLDWEGSAAWMVDATRVEVIGDQREGTGTWIRAVTRIAGVRLVDEMIVTRWEPERLLQVHHTGRPIRGVAWFGLSDSGSGTTFEWAEELDPPLGPLGELGGAVLRRPIERMLEKSAARLKTLIESEGQGRKSEVV